jgi:phytoene dehydrogenase-like protein
VHASVQAHYFDGAWYPRGGGAAIPRAFVNALKRNGGSIRLETRVERILTEPAPDGGRRAVGVKLADGTEVRARAVISNADPGVTYGRLFPPAEVPGEVRRALDKARWSVSCLSLYLAVDADLRSWGLDSGNLWYSRTPDVQAGYAIAQRAELDGDDFPGQFLTVTTLKDPSKGVGTTHTLESFVFVSWDAFRTWAHTKFGERPADYAAMKDALADRMLRNIDRFVPGLSRHVTFRELGTPLTNAHYCMSTRGNLYGTAKDAWQVGPFAWRVRSPIGGLFLCGASTISHGVMGATMSGLYAAAAVARCSSDELLRSQGPELRTLPCDDLSAWPEDLRKRIALKRAARGAEAVAADA